MSVAAVAVVRFFHRNPLGENRWRRRLAPIVSATFLITMLLLTLAFFGQLLGATDPIRIWATPAAYLLVAASGVAWAYHLKRNRPEAWAVIGLGDRAVPVRRIVLRRAPSDADDQARHAYINGH